MWRKFIALSILCVFTPIAFQHVVIVMDYYSNQPSFITACINKSKPQLHCKGKCQLMIKLKQEEKKESQNPERKPGQKEEVVVLYNSSAAADQIPVFNQTPNRAFSSSFSSPGFVHAIFHPPALF